MTTTSLVPSCVSLVASFHRPENDANLICKTLTMYSLVIQWRRNSVPRFEADPITRWSRLQCRTREPDGICVREKRVTVNKRHINIISRPNNALTFNRLQFRMKTNPRLFIINQCLLRRLLSESFCSVCDMNLIWRQQSFWRMRKARKELKKKTFFPVSIERKVFLARNSNLT